LLVDRQTGRHFLRTQLTHVVCCYSVFVFSWYSKIPWVYEQMRGSLTLKIIKKRVCFIEHNLLYFINFLILRCKKYLFIYFSFRRQIIKILKEINLSKLNIMRRIFKRDMLLLTKRIIIFYITFFFNVYYSLMNKISLSLSLSLSLSFWICV